MYECMLIVVVVFCMSKLARLGVIGGNRQVTTTAAVPWFYRCVTCCRPLNLGTEPRRGKQMLVE